MKKAIYPGSFDPMTKGHIDIIKKSLLLFDEIYVVVAENPNKEHMFSTDERRIIVEKSLKNLDIPEGKKVFVLSFKGIITRLALDKGINFIIRGMRNAHDMQDEYAIEQFTENSSNKMVSTIYFSPSPEHIFTSSTLVRNFIKAGFKSKTKKYVDKKAYKYIKEKTQHIETISDNLDVEMKRI